MIQGGAPSETGAGNVGIKFEDELSPDLLFDRPGRLAMANSGPNTNSTQFFITEKETSFLNPRMGAAGRVGYTIFGQCDDSTVELVKKIARMPCAGGAPCDPRNSSPQNPVKIQHVEILNAGQAGAAKKP